MRKWILIIVTLIMACQSVSAQDQVGCLQLMEDAKEANVAGMVELVPELLLPCLESGLSGAPKQEAFKMVIIAYLFDYLPEKANDLMSRFLDEYPDYQASAADPSEFRILLASQQQQRDELKAFNREQELKKPVKSEPVEQKNERKASYPAGKELGVGVGFILGTNLSFPSLIEPYSLADPTMNAGTFENATPGFHLGGAAAFKLSRGVQAAFEVIYQRSRVKYTATPFTFTSYDYAEIQNRFGLPVSLLLTVNPDSRAQVYFRLGVMADYLMSAGASAVRSYTNTGSVQPDIVMDQVDITSSRRRMNWYGVGGMGIKVPFDGSYLFVESRFQYGFQNSNKESERYSNQDFTWLIYHVDSDFKMSQLNISAGMIFYFR